MQTKNLSTSEICVCLEIQVKVTCVCHINYHNITLTLTCVFPTVYGAVLKSFSSAFIARNIGTTATGDNFYSGYGCGYL